MNIVSKLKLSCPLAVLCLLLAPAYSGEQRAAKSAAVQKASACTRDCSRFSDVYPILRAKCNNCHTTDSQGNTRLADGDIRVAFQETQKPSYTVAGGTIGQAALVRIMMGSMPPGLGCTLNFAANGNAADCLTQKEFELLKNWVAGGQRP